MQKTILNPFRKNGLFGFRDEEGRTVIPPSFISIGGYKGDLISVGIDDKIGFIDRTGKVVIPARYDTAFDFTTPADPDEPSLACVFMGNLCGFINQEGQEVIPLKYQDFGGYWQGLFVVETRQGYGVINARGETVIPFEYQYLFHLTHGLLGAVKEDNAGLIDANNQVVVPFKYESIGPFNFGVSIVTQNRKANCIDTKGNLLFDRWYQDITPLDNGSYLLKSGSKKFTLAKGIDGPRETCIVEGNGVYTADGTTLLMILGKQTSVTVRKGAIHLAYLTCDEETANRCQLTHKTHNITFAEGVTEIGTGWEDIQDEWEDGDSIDIFLPSTLKKVHPDAFRGMVDHIHSITFSGDSHLQIASVLPPHLRPLVRKASALGAWFTRLKGYIMNEGFLNDPIGHMSDFVGKIYCSITGVIVAIAWAMSDGTFISHRVPFYTYLAFPLLAAAFTMLKLRNSRYVSSGVNFNKGKEETFWFLGGLWQWTIIYILPFAIMLNLIFGINRIGDGTPHNAKAVVVGIKPKEDKQERDKYFIEVPEKHVTLEYYANEVYAFLQVDRVVVVRYHTGLLGIDIIDDVR